VAPDSLFFDLDLDTLQLEIVNEGYGDLMWNVTDAPEWVTVVPDSIGQTASLSTTLSQGIFSLTGNKSSFEHQSIKMPAAKNPTSSLKNSGLPNKIVSPKSLTTKSDETRGLKGTTSQFSSSDTVLVIVDRSSLEHGMYYGDIHIASNGGDRTVAVEMEVPEVPTAPTGLVGEPWDSEVTLFWDQYEDTTIAAFNIWRGLSDSTINILDEIAPEATSYTDTTVTNGETYIYVLTAKDSLGYESGYSNSISVTPLGPALAITLDSLIFEIDIDSLYFQIWNEGYGDLTWNIGGLPSWLDIQIEGGLRIPSGRRNEGTPKRREMIAMESHKGREVFASVAPLHKTITTLSGVDTLLAIVDRSGLNYGIYDTTVDITSNGGDSSLYVWMGISNYAPDVTVTPFEAEQSDTVEIEFSIEDAEGDSVLLNVHYSFDESMTDTLPASLTEELILLGPDNYQGTLHWLTAEDLPDQEVDIYLLVEASDSFNVNSFMLPVHVDNYFGNVMIEPLTSEVEGDADISYTIEDSWGDTFSLNPQFFSPTSGVWLDATASGQMDEIGPEDYSGTLTWHTAEDFPSYEEPVSFRILPHDGLGLGTSDEISVDVDNLGPPQVISYSPAEDSLASWMSPELEVTFSRDIDTSTVEGSVGISGEISGDHSFSHTYDDTSRVLTLTVEGVFSSLETVTFIITPDLTDLDGIPFDGNGNGDVDDPEDDIFTGTFTTTLLGDYTVNGMVNTADFALFRDAWLDPLSYLDYDIGPASGEMPKLLPMPDSTIDFEDLMVFAQMWNWSYQSGNYDDSTAVLAAKATSDSPVRLERRESSDNGWLPVTEQRFWLDAYVSDFDESGLFELTLDVDQSSVSFERITSNLEEPWAVLHFFDEEYGRLTIVGAALALSHDVSGEEAILTVEFRKRIESETVLELGTSMWNLAGEETNYPESQYRLDLKPPLPEKAVLHQNYPNPFNPVTTIRYELPEEGHLKLSVVNLLGQQITTLYDGYQEEGFHEIIWSGRDTFGHNAATGIYFLVLETENRTHHRKMLLVK
jgi:hypothetical protein